MEIDCIWRGFTSTRGTNNAIVDEFMCSGELGVELASCFVMQLIYNYMCDVEIHLDNGLILYI